MLTINPAPLTVIADDKSMSFGGQMPALTASYVGFVNGDTPASLTTPLQLSTSVTNDSPAGTYAIILGGASSPDYTINYLGGTVTEDPYVPPAQSRYRAAAAFVTTLYAKIVEDGRAGAVYLLDGPYLAHQSPMNITRGFAQSISRAYPAARDRHLEFPCALSATMLRRRRDERPGRPCNSGRRISVASTDATDRTVEPPPLSRLESWDRLVIWDRRGGDIVFVRKQRSIPGWRSVDQGA